MQIEVCYAKADQQWLQVFEVAENTSVINAIDLSGVLTLFPEIDLTQQAVGIFGKVVEYTTLLKPGDRIEIYRPLSIDPQTARRIRAAKKKSKRA